MEVAANSFSRPVVEKRNGSSFHIMSYYIQEPSNLLLYCNMFCIPHLTCCS
ncbi:uncharacterized protein DS421_20g684970 [Arachis hypogaea]|nr:uncharacterized protein DS421_20g684970 [Arachis hypogaea]